MHGTVSACSCTSGTRCHCAGAGAGAGVTVPVPVVVPCRYMSYLFLVERRLLLLGQDVCHLTVWPLPLRLRLTNSLYRWVGWECVTLLQGDWPVQYKY